MIVTFLSPHLGLLSFLYIQPYWLRLTLFWPWYTAAIRETAVFLGIVHYLGRSTEQNWSWVVFFSSRWFYLVPTIVFSPCLASTRFLPRVGCHAIQTVKKSRAYEKKRRTCERFSISLPLAYFFIDFAFCVCRDLKNKTLETVWKTC